MAHKHEHTPTDFNEAAATWDDQPERLDRSRRIADAIAAAVPLASVVDALEYGCGTGQITWALADRLQNVTLADVSPGMLAVVHERIAARPADDRDRFHPVELDLTQQTLPPASLDLIYSSMALHHVPDVSLALRRMRQALRPGGHLAIADLDHDPLGHFHGENFDGHHGFDRDAFAAALTEAGFTDVAISTATTITKRLDGVPREFGLFLAVALA